MAQFALFHYELKEFENKHPLLFPLGDSSRQYKTMDNLFESYLPGRGGSLDVLEPKEVGKGEMKTTEYEPHESKVLQNIRHIVAFKVQKNAKKKIETRDWGQKDEPNYPCVRVLIDNRPNVHLMAIENKSTFKTDQAFDLLKTHFNMKLKDHYVRFECTPLVKKEDFWKAVDEIKNRFGDFIKRVQFNFVGEQRKESRGFADKLACFLQTINSSHGGIFMDFKDIDSLDNAKDDISNMAKLCYRNKNYNLSVKFRDFGAFSYGQDIKAQWGLDDEKIEEFSQQYRQEDWVTPGNTGYNAIAEWFDKITVLFHDYIESGIQESYDFDNYIIKKDHAVKIKQLLHLHSDNQKKPMGKLRVLAAAVITGTILKPTCDDYNTEFNANISKTSYNRYVKENDLDLCPYLGDAAFEQFKKLFGSL